MRETHFSKGPWRVERTAIGELETFNAGGIHLLSSDAEDALSLRERRANGRLMEVSPALFTALENAVEALGVLTLGKPHSHKFCVALREGKAALEAALEPLDDELRREGDEEADLADRAGEGE